MGKRIAILQSSYIPWKGYFDIVAGVDLFVLYDDVQFTRRDWRNRNLIKTAAGLLWLTIPVETKGRFHQRIDETVVASDRWPRRHWESIRRSYARAPFFRTHAPWLEELFLGCRERTLSGINHRFLEALCRVLGVTTPLVRSSGVSPEASATEKLIGLCRAHEATSYLTGPSARSYLDEKAMVDSGITVEYMDYSGYPEYPQLHPPFVHGVSILDLILSVGPEAPRYMKAVRR